MTLAILIYHILKIAYICDEKPKTHFDMNLFNFLQQSATLFILPTISSHIAIKQDLQ